jgi:outer membrane protein, heavy metal efflux system
MYGRMKRQLAVTIGFLMSSTPYLAHGQAPDEDLAAAIDLPHLRSYTLARNPEIQAMQERWRAARARPSQEGSLADPMVNTAYHNESFERFTQGSGDFTFLRFGVEQEVPFPGKLALKENVAARAADREGALYRAAVLDVVTRLRVAYDDYFLAHQSLEIVRKNRSLLEKLEQAAEARYKVGEGTQQDVLRAQVELSILLGRLTSLEQARQSSAAKLNALLNRPPVAPLGAPTPIAKEPLRHTLEELEALAREASPNLKAADLDVARADSNLALAKRQYYPDFILRADYFNKAALVPEWEVGAGIRIPLYFWRKQAFGVEEAAAGRSEARAARQAVAQDVLSKLKDFYAQAEAADRLVGLYGTAVVPQSELSLDSALASYQVGQVDFLTVLSNFTVLNDYRVSYYEQLANFDKAVAQLDQAAGVLPEDAAGGKTP